jgi:hypothetical protein
MINDDKCQNCNICKYAYSERIEGRYIYKCFITKEIIEDVMDETCKEFEEV